MFQALVPDGMRGGQKMLVETPSVRMEVEIPQGLEAGQAHPVPHCGSICSPAGAGGSDQHCAATRRHFAALNVFKMRVSNLQNSTQVETIRVSPTVTRGCQTTPRRLSDYP